MVIIMEIEELVPVLSALTQAEDPWKDVDNFADYSKEAYTAVSRMLNVIFAVDNDTDGLDTVFALANETGFSSNIGVFATAVHAAIQSIYPNGLIVSVDTMNRYGSIAITLRDTAHASHRDIIVKHR